MLGLIATGLKTEKMDSDFLADEKPEIYKPKIYLVEEQANPSSDFFVLPILQANGYQVLRCCFADLPNSDEMADAVVIFIRYVPAGWAKLVGQLRPKLRALIFFMDDDVLDFSAARGMPWRYRFKLARLATQRKEWLRQHQAQLWVSTTYLQHKYQTWPAQLVLPKPVSTPVDVCRVFYHGSASHQAEIQWLQGVVAEAVHAEPRLAFEIIGGQEVNRLYKNIPRTNIVLPMKWPSYQAFLALHERHIGLNPVHDSPFNRARSYTKFFDITRCRAVGIYNPNTACADVVEHQHDGLVVGLEKEAWAAAILSLAGDELQRQRLLLNAEAKMEALAEAAEIQNLQLLQF